MNRRNSVEKALHSYIRKTTAKGTTREQAKKYKKPERQTEADVLAWGRSNGFFFHVVDSSSYDPILGLKGMSKASAGLPDVIGNTPTGLSCWVELKAKDRRSTLSELQRLFLEQKIEQNCFAVVVDSAERLERFWKQFCALKSCDERQAFLFDCLPKKTPRARAPRDDFEKNHGF